MSEGKLFTYKTNDRNFENHFHRMPAIFIPQAPRKGEVYSMGQKTTKQKTNVREGPGEEIQLPRQ